MATPTVRRLQLGNELRHLRERADETIDAAAKIVERTTSTISRLELGQTALTQRQLGDLLDFYKSKIPDCEDTSPLLELAKGNEQRGRWSGYQSIYAKHFRMAVDLERDASSIRSYQTEIVAGLLQTRAYMQALFINSEVRTLDQPVEDAIRARLSRQSLLTAKDSAPNFGFVLSESALRRVVGSRDVMREQVEHLVAVAELPTVQLQIIPFEARTPIVPVYNFTTYRVPSPGQAGPLEFVYIEEYTNAHYLDDHKDADAYGKLWDRLVGAALDPMQSRDLLRGITEEYRADSERPDT